MAFTFPMEHQKETDWCWDAVAVSIEHFFDPHSDLTQEAFAEKVLGQPSNEPWYLSEALNDLGKLNGSLQGPLSFAQIQEQLDQNLPVCARIAWDEGGAHFVVISGYDVSGGTPKVHISDPLLTNSNVVTWDYESFVLAYDPKYGYVQAEGQWDQTCLVKP